ncbi:hypothetical protein CPT_Piffle_061 [Stenotrophomonas phage Piffle]|uniref:Uncharacterized protein n=2 Tax=Pokkenvirus TaxID=2842972 RepID=A0AAE8BJ92_9CAUD|nr:phosphofructokinase [Stenotrophomonas phage Paxi]YP_010659472.1 phosphofructokinase [Stenotrophomonas phage Piffle]QYW01826.1 hypothetical protein CPT_Paxi_060 [Stenotrophomonas phage Paxi]QYW01915.1 hypothetical protein CPT_Piffle_061 [Stenotrophomonas phage Piffle]
MPYVHASEFLQSGINILGERAADRDVVEERSMAQVVALFNLKHGTNLTEAQGWNFMATLKEVRARIGGKFRPDDYIDWLNYVALEAESRSKQ